MLSINNLQIRRGDKLFIDALNIAIKPGEFWGILGPNGCGKTTLLHTIAGFQAPFSGKITWQGQPIKSLQRKVRAKQIGILLQQYALDLPCTVGEFILSASYPHLLPWQQPTVTQQQQKDDLLERFGLIELEFRNMNQLSGGERRRAALAMLFLQNPSLFLLDEPCNHLDINYRRQVMSWLHDLVHTTKHACCMSSHDPNLVAEYCSHVVLIFPNGECRAGPVNELMVRANLERLFAQPFALVQTEHRPVWLAVE